MLTDGHHRLARSGGLPTVPPEQIEFLLSGLFVGKVPFGPVRLGPPSAKPHPVVIELGGLEVRSRSKDVAKHSIWSDLLAEVVVSLAHRRHLCRDAEAVPVLPDLKH